MKSYTDLKQSNKLAMILPLESADMWWNIDFTNYPSIEENIGFYQESKVDIPCWSLAALLNVLPNYEIYKSDNTIQLDVNRIALKLEEDEALIDLVVNMIVKLHELKLL